MPDNVTIIRRQNVLAIFQDYAERALAAGAAPKGLEQAFAATLRISPSMWSQVKSARPIGDKLARQIEALHGKSAGWLDEARLGAPPSAAEAAFVELATAAWRLTNSAGRRALREQMKRVLAEATGEAPGTVVKVAVKAAAKAPAKVAAKVAARG